MSVLFNFRNAVRYLRLHLGFSLLVVGTLGLGVAAATSVFSLVDTVVLRPLPFSHPERLVSLETGGKPMLGSIKASIAQQSSWEDFADWQAQSKSFEGLAAFHTVARNLDADSGPARRVNGMVVSSGFFSVLGASPVAGRDFFASEDAAGNRSVILSNPLAASLFGSAEPAIGHTIHIGGESYNVVGVLPNTFHYPTLADNDYWVTSAADREGKHPVATQRGYHLLEVVGRLKPQVSVKQAGAEMKTIQSAIAGSFSDTDKDMNDVKVQSLSSFLTGDVRQPLLILLSSVLFLLLIACTNVAGLLLTRVNRRRGEFAVRAALGARRSQIIGHIISESLVLSLLSGVLGLALSAAALKVAHHYLPQSLPRIDQVGIDARVLVFCIVSSLATGILFGVLPGWRAAKTDPASSLGDVSRGALTTRKQQRLQNALVIAETAIGLVLLVGAGLLIRSFGRVIHSDPGFNPAHVLTFRVGIPQKGLTDDQQLVFYKQLRERLQAIPGVQSASYGFPQPLTGGDASITFKIDERPTAMSEEPDARLSVVAASLFQTLGIPLKRGRLFTEAEDQPTGAKVVLINEAFARQFFPNEDPIGKYITPGVGTDASPSTSRAIIGIVGNVTRGAITEEAAPEYYLPYSQADIASPPLAIRVSGDPLAYANTVRSVVASLNPNFPVYRIASYDELLDSTTALQRFQTALISGFAALALLLAAVGLYAVLSYMVTQRTIELGLRMALGAKRSQVLSLVLGQGVRLALAGVVIGLAAALFFSRLLASVLYKTHPLDTATFAVTGTLFLLIAAFASALPAWRASRLQPNDCLRQQ